MYTVITADVSDAQHKAAVGQLLEQYHRQTEREKAIHGIGAQTEGLPLPPKYQNEIDDPEASFAHAHVLMATDGPDVVGMLVLTVDAWASEVKRLWVTPSARGSGAGSALLQQALAVAKDFPSRAVRLTVWPWREPALRSYRRLGFLDVPSWDPRSDLVCMELVLDRNNAGSRD
jgi:ribosomal protein S18 acetylase RimI-like enzyme